MKILMQVPILQWPKSYLFCSKFWFQNMLIAMMGNTYAIVIEKSEKEFLKQVPFRPTNK